MRIYINYLEPLKQICTHVDSALLGVEGVVGGGV